MRFSIGLKIFSVAGFMCAVMIAAAIASEFRLRDADERLAGLSDFLIPISDCMAELRAIALQEESVAMQLVHLAEHGEHIDPDLLGTGSKGHSYDERLAKVEENIEAVLHTGNGGVESISFGRFLVGFDARFEGLIAKHREVHNIVERIVENYEKGELAAVTALIEVYKGEQADFDSVAQGLTTSIRDLVDTESEAAKQSQRFYRTLSHVITGLSALLGLGLAGLFVFALVRPIRRLRDATLAIEQGDFEQSIEPSSRDEIGELCRAFNGMVFQLKANQRTQEMFGRYVDPRVVNELVGDLDGNVGSVTEGHKQEATVFFSDIEGFTSISERLSPVGLVRIMNAYFSLATEGILERHGLIDKLIGDAIMAFWCPPFAALEAKGELACAAALAQFRQLDEVNRRLPDLLGVRSEVPSIDIRVGLATGEVVVGSIGSERTRSFTVMGDTVNLGARIESTNKIYGTRILICEQTRAAAGDTIEARQIDMIAVRGRREPVRVFELAAERGNVPAQWFQARDAYEGGLTAFWARDWEGAETSFRRCLELAPDDPPSNVFLARVAALRASPPPDDWDGVWRVDDRASSDRRTRTA